MKSRRLVFGAWSALAFAVAAMVVVALFALGGNGAPDTAHAQVTPTVPAGATATATKPSSEGSLSGLVDIWVGDGPLVITAILFDCIGRVDHDTAGTAGDLTDDVIKSATQCNSELDLGDPQAGNYVDAPDYDDDTVPDEGLDAGTAFNGPPPPPAYTPYGPAKGLGVFFDDPAVSDPDIVVDDTTVTSCFPNLGGTAGPNIIATVVTQNAKTQAGDTTADTSLLDIWYNQGTLACDSLTPKGAPTFNDVAVFFWRTGDTRPALLWPRADADFDGDGCDDIDELNKQGRPKGCGDDPWNPGDSGAAADNLSGDYDVIASVARANICQNGLPAASCDPEPDGTIIPGFYYPCIADIQHTTNADIKARISCYIDSPVIEINPELGGACPSVVFCGDGLVGGGPPIQPPPPTGPAESGLQCVNNTDNDLDTVPNDGCQGVFGDVNTKHTELTGTLDKTNNVLNLSGCFEDLDSQAALGNVFIRAKVDQYTGHGLVNIWIAQTPGNCTGGTPSPAAPNGGQVPVDFVRQNNDLGLQGKPADLDDGRDSDGDGCSNKDELADSPNTGGLRDPANPWDYFEPTMNGQARAGDISYVVDRFFLDYLGSQTGYTTNADRSAISGANAWNFGTGNLQIRAADISAAVKTFFMDCGNNPREERINHTTS